MEYKSLQLDIILLSLLLKKAGVCKTHAEIRKVRAFKRYNKEQFRSEVAGVPWSVVE